MAATVFSTQLQALRKEKGIKQEELANYLGVSTQAVSKWENGSYPDGDLLPKIADYYNVSIDYLYGRDNGETIEERITKYVKAIKDKEEEQGKGKKQEALGALETLIWAMQRGIIKSEPTEKCLVAEPKEGVKASVYIDDSGFDFMRLTSDMEYYVWVKKPKEGFGSYLKVTKELTELFHFLGDEANLNVLFYLLTLKNDEAVRTATIEKRLGLPREKVKQALDFLVKIHMIYENSLIDENDNGENVYTMPIQERPIIIQMLIGAEGMFRRVRNYSLSVNCEEEEAWFDREGLFPRMPVNE